MKTKLSRLARLAAFAVALLAASGPAWACPVCYGSADNAMIDGAKASVLFMGVLVYCLLGAVVAVVFALRRRAKKLAALQPDHHRGLKLVQPTEGVAR
jgi:heme/copper-type cytochrome/quinol oxidase subunit 2